MTKSRTLPQRHPGEALAEQRLGEALADLDHEHARACAAEQDLDEARAETKLLAEDLAATTSTCDDLTAQALPYLDTATWPQTEPVESVVADQVAAELGYKGWD